MKSITHYSITTIPKDESDRIHNTVALGMRGYNCKSCFMRNACLVSRLYCFIRFVKTLHKLLGDIDVELNRAV
jgi:hypothetical protein